MIEKQFEKEVNELLLKFNMDMSGYRTDILSPNILSKIVVQINDQFIKLNHISSISNINHSQLNINVWEEQNTKSVIKAIDKENMSLSLSSNGNVIIVTRPPMSHEYRQELIKQIKRDCEKYKQSIRVLRQKYNKKCETLNNPNSVKKKIQKITDEKCSVVDDKIKDKINEMER